jgi:hypothetical protein
MCSSFFAVSQRQRYPPALVPPFFAPIEMVRGKFNPASAAAQRLHDAADDPPIIDPRQTAWLIRQQRPNSFPLRVAQTEPVLHDHAPGTLDRESLPPVSLQLGWRPAFPTALAGEAEDGLQLLFDLERAWFAARRRRNSRPPRPSTSWPPRR